jgi:glucokinase
LVRESARQEIGDLSEVIGRSQPHFVLAIDFGGTKIAVGCATLGGDLLVQRRLSTSAARGATQAVGRALAAGRALSRDLVDRYDGQLIGVGLVSPGVVLADQILLAPNVPGWERLSLRQLAAEQFPGIPVATCNDARAAAVAELRWGHLQGIRSGLYVNVGTGVSAAVVIDGRVLAGSHQAAGEIGYARADPAADGPGYLELLLGGRWLARRASLAAGRRLSVADALSTSEPVIREVVDKAIDTLGHHLANFSILLDPERIVMGGGLMNAAERILPRLRHWLLEVVPFPPELMAGAFVTDAALRGAAAIAIDAAAEQPLDGRAPSRAAPERVG